MSPQSNTNANGVVSDSPGSGAERQTLGRGRVIASTPTALRHRQDRRNAFSFFKAAWIDYDNDGWTDFSIGGVALYRNNNGLNFSTVPGASVVGQGVWGDWDNDGDPDHYYYHQPHGGFPKFVVRRNDGGGNFTSVQGPTPVATDNRSACWADFSGDGFIDLYIGAYEAGGYQPDTYLVNQGDTNESYTVQRSTNLVTDTFNAIAAGLPGVAPVNIYTDNMIIIDAAPSYRVEQE